MLKDLFGRIRGFLARLFRRKPPAAGYFEKGSKWSLHGFLRAAPWVLPSRDYLVYIPRGFSRWKRRALVVMIHGCKQTPEDFAAATRIAALADEKDFLVLMPRQTKKANPWSCWNWFDRATSAGRGEAAIVAAQVKAVRRAWRADPKRIFVAGFSAGGALAAALGVRHPGLFAGVFVHSGIACGAAAGPHAAIQVMRDGAGTDPGEIGSRARSSAGGEVRLPLVVLHGDDDAVVAKVHALQVARQYLALNAYPGVKDKAGELPPPDAEDTATLPSGRKVTTTDYRDGDRPVVRLVRVAGLDHSWSGGDAAFPYNDATPPDATKLLGEFVHPSSPA